MTILKPQTLEKNDDDFSIIDNDFWRSMQAKIDQDKILLNKLADKVLPPELRENIHFKCSPGYYTLQAMTFDHAKRATRLLKSNSGLEFIQPFFATAYNSTEARFEWTSDESMIQLHIAHLETLKAAAEGAPLPQTPGSAAPAAAVTEYTPPTPR